MHRLPVNSRPKTPKQYHPFYVLLHSRNKDDFPLYFTRQNQIVTRKNADCFYPTFDEASNAAKRARLQDTSKPLRLVTAEEATY